MSIDKRKHARIERCEDVMFARKSVHPFCYFGGTTLDCSLGGLCLESRYQVEPGENLCLRMIGKRLQSFASIDDLTCNAEVRWCGPIASGPEPAYRIGLHFHGYSVPPLFKP